MGLYPTDYRPTFSLVAWPLYHSVMEDPAGSGPDPGQIRVGSRPDPGQIRVAAHWQACMVRPLMHVWTARRCMEVDTRLAVEDANKRFYEALAAGSFKVRAC